MSIYSRCSHQLFESQFRLEDKAYCKQCGVLFYYNKEGECKETRKPPTYDSQMNNNPLLYIKELEQYEDEHVMCQPTQWYIQNRPKAIKFLKKQCNYFNISEKTFFSALAYLDTLMSSFGFANLTEREYALKVISCFILAGKFSENDSRTFNLNEFASSFDKPEVFSKEEIIQCEIETIKQLDYNLGNVNLYEYISCILNCGIVLKDEIQKEEELESIYSFSLRLLAQMLLLKIYPKYTYYQIVFSIVFITRKHFNLKNNVVIIKNLFNVFSWEYLNCADYILRYDLLCNSFSILNKQKYELSNNSEEDNATQPRLYSSKLKCFKEKDDKKGYTRVTNDRLLKESTEGTIENTKAKFTKTNLKKCGCRVSCFSFLSRKISVPN